MCECNKLSQWMSYRISCMTITFYLIICLYKDRHRVNLVKKELDVITTIPKYIYLFEFDISCANVTGFT